MAKHHPDLIFCRKQPGIAIGRLCEKCDGKCVICDSYVRPSTLVRICDECNFGSFQGRCVVCGSPGVSDAYYCVSCTRLEKDREGCPKIINLGSSKTVTIVHSSEYALSYLFIFIYRFNALQTCFTNERNLVSRKDSLDQAARGGCIVVCEQLCQVTISRCLVII
ncbi:PHF5-like protein-domain-containing protein [Jimgerdemannia flammicorona]|uniref:PHF5-like protein-domain-containing protein n=1 Tax=Jimgerdemannia flammicorona TaxID=994334 RepID=A0A433QP22_9FUNG|nr:PHF5-like protein-domain-containing protein [Jimgerdemannia flammicorona]